MSDLQDYNVIEHVYGIPVRLVTREAHHRIEHAVSNLVQVHANTAVMGVVYDNVGSRVFEVVYDCLNDYERGTDTTAASRAAVAEVMRAL